MIGTYALIVLLVICDQLVKWWTVSTFALHTGQTVIDGVFSFYYLRNNGAAWGILSGNMWFFYTVTIVFLGGMIYWMHKQSSKTLLEKITYILLFSGAVGNFIDRIRLGYVIDMLQVDFIDFPVFNVADIYVSCGCALLILMSVFSKKEDDL